MKLLSRVCENCGGKILGNEPKGLCLGCVLENGLGSLADETVAGGVDSGRPGGVLKDFGDYELLEESDEAVKALFIAPGRKVSTAPSH